MIGFLHEHKGKKNHVGSIYAYLLFIRFRRRDSLTSCPVTYTKLPKPGSIPKQQSTEEAADLSFTVVQDIRAVNKTAGVSKTSTAVGHFWTQHQEITKFGFGFLHDRSGTGRHVS